MIASGDASEIRDEIQGVRISSKTNKNCKSDKLELSLECLRQMSYMERSYTSLTAVISSFLLNKEISRHGLDMTLIFKPRYIGFFLN